MTRSLLWLLVLILRNLLQDAVGQTPPQGFKYVSYEVIIPRKLTRRYGQQEPQHINYWLQIGGKGHLVHLKQKKGIIPKQFPVFTYSKEGNFQVDYPFIRDDCYYHGFVQDKTFSLAALSTCSGGLRGILRFDNMTYEIQPIQPSATFQHIVYRLEEKEDAVTMRCGLTEEERRHQEAMIHSRKNTASKTHSRAGWWPHIRYVKNAVVLNRREHERYVQFGRNDTLVAMRVIEIIHLSNSFYKPLAVELSLVGLEIWSEKNLIHIRDKINEILSDFNEWRRDTLVKRIANDAGHLLVYKSFGSTVGLAFIGTICDGYWASAVESYMTSSMFYISNTFTHELGHVLGMIHDEKYCTCGRDACIMAAFQANTDTFSNCSYTDYFKQSNKHCLFIPPDPDKIYKHKYCGNKIVEHGEQCDCGSKSECESNPCCQDNCMLRSGATCAAGMCCAKCSYLPAGTLCRKETSTCDLPEYCNGTSEWCPKDFYVQDGAPCKDGTYCYHGSCSTHHEQCQEIFGLKAEVASEDCFRTVNIQGDRFGNCGLRHGIYKKCSAKNSLCGRIQCDKVDRLPMDEHRTVIQTPISNKRCWGLEYHSGMNLTDSGAVKNGTPCGIDMMCVNGECTSVSFLKYDCNATNCYNHGRCNNLKHCHCDVGWAPPDCQEKGNGGSVDSGPPPVLSISNGSSGSGSSKSGDRYRGVKIGITVIFLSGFILLTGLAVYYRNKLKDWLRTKFNVQSTSES
ncbi:disintegrin and metalloproteinase domain-containing protein 21-like [Tiliqua scincoides]|uniref:disintegrin and metalloproteinase domain-containing protein 21-like n=1 Tax=Tiliqua scincoides TaxID=71010 RepID=UPI0034634D74